MITIFTIPKSFEDDHINIIQTNAIKSWVQLKIDCEIILIGDDPGVKEKAIELNVKNIPIVKKNDRGTPLLNSAFELARDALDNDYIMYVNSDIILMDNFCKIVSYIKNLDNFLVMGRRHMLDVRNRIDFEGNWQKIIYSDLKNSGYLDIENAIDYFLFDKNSFKNIPPFAVGRVCWDNWMIYEARRQKKHVIDATNIITAVHQKHEYRHLKNNGKDRAYNSEATKNREYAGGNKHIFDLNDVNLIIKDQKLIKKSFSFLQMERYLKDAPEVLKFKNFWLVISFCYKVIRKILKIILPSSAIRYLKKVKNK